MRKSVLLVGPAVHKGGSAGRERRFPRLLRAVPRLRLTRKAALQPSWSETMIRRALVVLVMFCLVGGLSVLRAAEYEVSETDEEIRIVTPQLEAAVRKQGY